MSATHFPDVTEATSSKASWQMAGWVGAILFLQLIGVRRDTWFVSEDQSTEQGFFARFEGQMIGHKIRTLR